MFYAYFVALGVDVQVEEATHKGLIDLAVVFEWRCYLFEFKVVDIEPEGRALSQIKARGYHGKYLSKCREVYLIGVEFSRKDRNIVDFSWERTSPLYNAIRIKVIQGILLKINLFPGVVQ